MAEFDLMVKQYRLEDFGDALVRSVALINKMINWGVIEESREGVKKGMEMIVHVDPSINDSFRRFTSAVAEKNAMEIKKMEKPN